MPVLISPSSDSRLSRHARPCDADLAINLDAASQPGRPKPVSMACSVVATMPCTPDTRFFNFSWIYTVAAAGDGSNRSKFDSNYSSAHLKFMLSISAVYSSQNRSCSVVSRVGIV